MNNYGLKSLQSSNVFGRKNEDTTSSFGKKLSSVKSAKSHAHMEKEEKKEHRSPLERY